MFKIGEKFTQSISGLSIPRLILFILVTVLSMVAGAVLFGRADYLRAALALMFPLFFLYAVLLTKDGLFLFSLMGISSTVGGLLIMAGLNFWVSMVIISIPIAILVWRKG